jgi:hypothetical protein
MQACDKSNLIVSTTTINEEHLLYGSHL